MMGHKGGFTILELLVVMLIIAILAGLGSKGYSLARRQAKESQALAEIEKLRSAFEEFRVEFGCYPSQLLAGEIPALDFITNAIEGVELFDPWGNPYQYICTNRFLYTLWSKGQDASEDNDNINAERREY